MGENVDRLVGMKDAEDRFDLPYAEIRDIQIAAMDERLQERVDKIKLLRLRAEDTGISRIETLEDMVPCCCRTPPTNLIPKASCARSDGTSWLGGSAPSRPIRSTTSRSTASPTSTNG